MKKKNRKIVFTFILILLMDICRTPLSVNGSDLGLNSNYLQNDLYEAPKSDMWGTARNFIDLGVNSNRTFYWKYCKF